MRLRTPDSCRSAFAGSVAPLLLAPQETMEDVHAILELGAACRALMLEQAKKTGVIGNVHLGCNILIPKPYTPWQREPMDDERSLKQKIWIKPG